MNTRRHPRTMNEAFTRTVDYAASLERPPRFGVRRMARIAPIIMLIVVAIYVVAFSFAAR